MSRVYECVWYQHLAGNEEQSAELIDKAVQIGNAADLEPGDILAIYSRARAAQKTLVDPVAVTIAQNRESKINRIDGQVQPTLEETNQALLELYRAQCEES